jgi:predicted nucleic acid-binding protein
VSNTSPLLGLAAIEQLHLLHHQLTEILIPPAVLQELKLDTDFTGTKFLRQAIESGWLRVEAVSNVALVQALRIDLDWGESEAIALAIERGLTTIVMDERDGRTRAKAMGLSPIGVVGILLRAKKSGELASLSKALDALRHTVGFFISRTFQDEVLREAGEK